MPTEDMINEVHGLVADATKLGAKQERDYILFYLRKNLGPDLALNTGLSQKKAYAFALEYIDAIALELEARSK